MQCPNLSITFNDPGYSCGDISLQQQNYGGNRMPNKNGLLKISGKKKEIFMNETRLHKT